MCDDSGVRSVRWLRREECVCDELQIYFELCFIKLLGADYWVAWLIHSPSLLAVASSQKLGHIPSSTTHTERPASPATQHSTGCHTYTTHTNRRSEEHRFMSRFLLKMQDMWRLITSFSLMTNEGGFDGGIGTLGFTRRILRIVKAMHQRTENDFINNDCINDLSIKISEEQSYIFQVPKCYPKLLHSTLR